MSTTKGWEKAEKAKQSVKNWFSFIEVKLDDLDSVELPTQGVGFFNSHGKVSLSTFCQYVKGKCDDRALSVFHQLVADEVRIFNKGGEISDELSENRLKISNNLIGESLSIEANNNELFSLKLNWLNYLLGRLSNKTTNQTIANLVFFLVYRLNELSITIKVKESLQILTRTVLNAFFNIDALFFPKCKKPKPIFTN